MTNNLSISSSISSSILSLRGPLPQKRKTAKISKENFLVKSLKY